MSILVCADIDCITFQQQSKCGIKTTLVAHIQHGVHGGDRGYVLYVAIQQNNIR